MRLIREVPSLQGARVTVMGLGLFGGGVGVTRFLLQSGADVTVTDLRTEETLHESVAALSGWPVRWRLGGHHEEDFREADLVIVNPAVPPESPYLRHAPAMETETNLFLKLCPARTVVGITGSNGKTTTTVLTGEILKQSTSGVHVGGNLGGSLLESLPEISPDHIVVLELSSFQLENMATLRRSPQVATVLNLTPNHLDRHGTMERYVEAKKSIVQYQRPEDTKVLNDDDPLVRLFAEAAPSRTCPFRLSQADGDGAWLEGNRLHLRWNGLRASIDAGHRRIPGRFNLQNLLAAAATSRVALGENTGPWEKAVKEVIRTFPGVEHRLEFVVEKGGIKYYNDSIATSPESTMAALETLAGPIVLLAGGYDKKLPLEALGDAIVKRVRSLVVLGKTGPKIAEVVRGRGPEIASESSFDAAVHTAMTVARPGDTVLLSPASASWDMFRNFEERGRRFCEIVLSS